MTKHPPRIPPASRDEEKTRVDLGEDLIEEVHPHETASARSLASDTPEDRFASAKILKDEGLLEEAKKLLHSILIQDPRHLAAKDFLFQIHEIELKQIFHDNRRKRIFPLGTETEEIDLVNLDSAEILKKLDEDLNLNLKHSEVPSLLDDPAHRTAFLRELDRQLEAAPPQDRIDLGIGFTEMGLHEVATHCFQTAAHAWAEDSDPQALQAIALLAFSLILAGTPFEASQIMQPWINDPEISVSNKIELFYLMGRAQEVLGNLESAHQWYLKTEALDADYRDIKERLRPRKGG